MLFAAIVCFAIAILLGLLQLGFVIQGKQIPRWISLTHGPLALIGIVILVVYAFQHGTGPIASIILFIIAGLGGFMMFYKDITGKKIPPLFALVHGLLAFFAFIALVISIFVFHPAG